MASTNKIIVGIDNQVIELTGADKEAYLAERKELKKLLSIPKETLIENYNKLKLDVFEKLNSQKDTSDEETSKTIDQVLNKLQNESFNELNYYKLGKLNEGL